MPRKEKPAESSQDVTSLVAVMKDMMAMQQRTMIKQQQVMADKQQVHMQEMKLVCEAIAGRLPTAYVDIGDKDPPTVYVHTTRIRPEPSCPGTNTARTCPDTNSCPDMSGDKQCSATSREELMSGHIRR